MSLSDQAAADLAQAHSLQAVAAPISIADQAIADLAAAQPKASPLAPLTADPTEGMSTGEKILAGTGRGMASVARAILPTAATDYLGIPRGAEAARLDAPLMSTGAGQIGNILGGAAATAPAMLIPGANTYLGAAGIGAGLGALTTEGDLATRAKAAGYGAAGGIIGKAAGDVIGAGLGAARDYLGRQAATEATANAARDEAINLAQQHGYAIPPQDVNPGPINAALEGLSGKIKTSQAASQGNQTITNKLAKQAIGLPEDVPLSADMLAQVRNDAGRAYQVVRNTGTVTPGASYANALDAISQQANGAAKSFPGLKNDAVESIIDTLRQPKFEAGDAVDAVSTLRAMADKAYRQGDNLQGKAFKQASGALEDALDQHMQALGNPDALAVFRDARQTIAKTYTVQSAMTPAGNVDAGKLATALGKGKPLSGELQDVAKISAAFPKATQALKQNYNPLSPLDFAMAGMEGAAGLAMHGPAGLTAAGLQLARPAARGLILSAPVQAINANMGTSYGMIPALMDSGARLPLKDILQLGATQGAVQQAQK